ncbi:hypothetical protein ACFW0H_02355 [Pseudomonas sp. CR3202]|uniref:hypothetical protein n=1 Tax=Pseudomonas sp. CR3202 TaxID=3351532 RepID=UPI003BF21B13
MKISTENSRIFNRCLIFPVAIVYMVALVFCEAISNGLPGEYYLIIPGVMKFAGATRFSCEAISMWSLFWITMPLFFVSTVYISFCAEVERRAGVIACLMVSIVMGLLFFGFAWWVFNGPSDSASSGRLISLYRNNYLGFLVLSFSAWICFYGLIYAFLKGVIINFEEKLN